MADQDPSDEALRTSEARLHAFIDSSSSVFYLKDLEGRHILVNREFERMAGKKREEILGKTDYDFVDRDTAEAFRADDRKVLATGMPLQLAHEVVLNGRRHSFLTTKFPVRDVRGQVYGVGGISTDVTEQQRLEAELRASERRFRTLTQSTADIVWTIDGSGRGFRDSASWRAFTGQSEATAASDRASEAVHPDDRSRLLEAWQAAIVEKRPFAMEYRVRRHDGVYVPMAARGAPVLDDDGRVCEWIGSCTDVSGAKKLEDERAHALAHAETARAEAERAVRAKDEFLAMLGHELRNPLAPIVTALELIKRRQPSTRELEVVERQVQHVVRLVDDLLDVSRITRGKIELKKEPVELGRVIAEGVEIASPLYEERRHLLDVDVAPSGLLVEGDETRLAQVVANLLTNAAKYTPPGGRVTVSAAREGNELVVRVEDNGIGISAELLPRVFELFVQGDRPVDRAEGGLGLGLALVRSLVQLHGGSVTATSAGVARGSEFVVRLPALDGGRAAARAADGARTPRTVTPRRVLIVDDNEDAAEMLAEMLRVEGHVTRVAYDGPSALQLVADGFRPELAILDIGLPVMDGYELAVKLRQSLAGAAPKMVALTGYGQEHDRARSARAGFALHLVKPVTPERLLAFVGSAN